MEDFTKCPHYKDAEDAISQTNEIHAILGVMKETLKWHKIIGYCIIASFLTLGAFVLVETKENTKVKTELVTTQLAVVTALTAHAKNIEVLNKNITDSSIMNISLTTDYMLKMVNYEKGLDEVARDNANLRMLLNRNFGQITALTNKGE